MKIIKTILLLVMLNSIVFANYISDKNRLTSIIQPFLKSNNEIQALLITDSKTDNVVLRFYRNGDDLIFQKKIPEQYKKLPSYKSKVLDNLYKDRLIMTFYKKAKISIEYTKEEQQWLSQNPVNRIAVMNYWPHDDNGDSLHTELLKLINKYSGVNLIPIKFNQWSDGYKQASTNTGVKGIMGLSKNKERMEKYFYYSPPYDFTPCYLVVRKDNNTIKSLEDLKDKTIYLKENSITHTIVKNLSKDINIVDLKNIDEMYKKLSQTKEAQAILSYFIDKTTLDKYNLKVVQNIPAQEGEVSIGIHHDYPHLASIINKAFQVIPKEELIEIRERKWGNKIKHKDLIVNLAEKKWLSKNITVKYSYDTDWKPFEWKNELDHHQGIVADFIKLIEQKSGIKFEAENTNSWKESIENVLSKRTVMFSAVGETPDRLKYLNFTKNTLYSTPYVLVSRDEDDYLDGLYNINGRIATLKDSTIEAILKNKKTNIDFILLDSVKQGFDQLQSKGIDVFIVNATTAKYYINILNYKNLKIAYKLPDQLDLKIAIRKEMPEEILTIIDKTLVSITDKEISDIVHKWTETKIEKKTDWALINKIIIGILIIFILLYMNMRKLKQLVAEKTADIETKKRELEHILSSFDENIAATRTDTKGLITYASEAFCKLSGYTKEELIGKTHRVIKHPDTPNNTYKEIWSKITKDQKWTGELKSLDKLGNTYWVQSTIQPEYDSQGKLFGYSSVRHDITAKKEVQSLQQEIEDTQKEVVFTMGSIGESRSKETGNHVKRVAQYTYILAKYYGLDLKECEMLQEASPMHDIGKVAIPDYILNKPARLNFEEMKIMETHAQAGYDMLKHSSRPLLKMAAIVAYEHHEKWDGSGYPNKTAGEDIHIYGRITALADVFDALGSDRVYKKAWADEKIFAFFKEQRAKHFDPQLIDIFFENLDEFLEIRNKLKDL